jgi:hypothetical protein
MLRVNFDDLFENGQKGDWAFSSDSARIAVRYGETHLKGTVILPINVSHGWQWDGNRESPTLSPSILVESVPNWNDGWHGFLRNGKLETV